MKRVKKTNRCITDISDKIDKNIMKYIPKSKQHTIKSCWHDSDGYWITLNYGYNAGRTDWNCHTIHEDTIAELRYQIAGIEINPEETGNPD